MGCGWIFNQENDKKKKKTSKSTQKCVPENKMKPLPWPSQLPLNPIENEWGELKRRSKIV